MIKFLSMAFILDSLVLGVLAQDCDRGVTKADILVSKGKPRERLMR